MNTNDANTKEGVEKRTTRAACESMSIDRYAGETGEYDVYSESGSVYRVDLVAETCDCPSAKYQAGACKHLRRVEMETGQREVPDLDEETDVERMIDARTDQSPSQTDQQAVATDGGTPEITRHVEPESQALVTGEPATYFRCTCGTEAMREQDLRSEVHREECEHQ